MHTLVHWASATLIFSNTFWGGGGYYSPSIYLDSLSLESESLPFLCTPPRTLLPLPLPLATLISLLPFLCPPPLPRPLPPLPLSFPLVDLFPLPFTVPVFPLPSSLSLSSQCFFLFLGGGWLGAGLSSSSSLVPHAVPPQEVVTSETTELSSAVKMVMSHCK